MQRYSKDTRSIQPGEYYVAIKGMHFDGHDFVQDAIRKGAAGVVLERPVDVNTSNNKVDVIMVDDSEKYLAEQAHLKIKTINPDIVAVTGSLGKTNTKNAIATILEQRFPVVSSQGNLNTILGLSLTILNADFSAETKLVLEMGASRLGDIAALCAYFPPDISVVTNVHEVHLASFGTLETVAQTKGELVSALKSEGVACLNYDDPWVREMHHLHKGRTIFYGKDKRSHLRPDAIGVELPLLGGHAVYIALAAYGVGRALGLSDGLVNQGLSALKPEKGRLFKLPGVQGITLIDDSYNASSAATEAALAVMRQQAGSRYIVFLGDMLELGERALQEHARMIRSAVNIADQVILAGDLMAAAAATLPREIRDRLALYPTSLEIADEISKGRIYRPTQGDVVLVKGSQGMRMERISKVLLHPDIEPSEVLPRQSISWQHI